MYRGNAFSSLTNHSRIATFGMTWVKCGDPIPPDAIPLGLTGVGALVVNVLCALILKAFKYHSSSLPRAIYLSARNDAVGNIAIIAASILTAATSSIYPDIVVGLGIFAINLDAAREVFRATRQEHIDAKA